MKRNERSANRFAKTDGKRAVSKMDKKAAKRNENPASRIAKKDGKRDVKRDENGR